MATDLVKYVPSGPVPPAEEIMKQCILTPGMEGLTYTLIMKNIHFYQTKREDLTLFCI